MNQLAEHAVPFVLCLLRLSGLFVFGPILTSVAIPGRVKILLAFTMAVAIFPTIPPMSVDAVAADPLTFGAMALGEVTLGTLIGAMAFIPVAAVQLGGTLVSQQMGFSLAAVFNPALDTESEAIGELLLYLALSAFIALGGLEIMFLTVATSFQKVPPGGVGITDLPSGLLIGAVSSGMELALRVSTPVLGIILIETIATGFLMKTMPQLNILSVGFATKIAMGLIALALGAPAILRAVSAHTEQWQSITLKWAAP